MIAGGRFLEVGGERVHVVERGSGPPLLLVHGFPSNATAFAGLMPLLEDRFAMTAVDMVGFGLSTRRIRRPLDGDAYAYRLAALLDALGQERPHVVGLSWAAPSRSGWPPGTRSASIGWSCWHRSAPGGSCR